MKCIVGLGNPGKRYERTRHNVGFLVIDALIEQEKLKPSLKFKGQIAYTLWKGEPVLLFKPETYMNLSGEAIRLVMDYYQLKPQDFLVIYDDLDLPFAQLRLREKGSAGGHNGMKSIIQHLKTEEFPRLRIGIDKNPLIETKAYVLGRLSDEELKSFKAKLPQMMAICQDFSQKKFVDVMSQHNKKP